MTANIVLLDNFDSFTWNLVDQFRSDGLHVTVFRNNVPAAVVVDALASETTVLVLSPGPGHPSAAGCMPELIRLVRGRNPIIGICLGHQAIIESYGGTVGGANEVFHGKHSLITHTGQHMFANLPCPLQVARYHSLAGTHIPESLDVVATMDDTIMAVLNQQDRVCGFQFHPESIMTPQGISLLQQTIGWATTQTIT
jgi:anthranilate synthase/aminodeoxychorismate synthase-like glutamine amidotransferase